ncbi:ABC transporter permease [Bacteroides sp. 214]|uniref:ABC transporter permease n=1 Tax=Bacteroides sp. 214 TaxID=2302935 RepID=UPI00351B01F2
MKRKFTLYFSSRKSFALPYIIFSAIFVIIPLLLIAGYAFIDENGTISLSNFINFSINSETNDTFIYSLGVAIITTFFCILLGYPAAWILSNKKYNKSHTIVLLFLLPMGVNILIRTLASVALFDFLHIPLGEEALIFGMVYNFIPFMIYPIYNSLAKIDRSYIEAAQDLGATPVQIFFKITLPFSTPGLMGGIMMVFMPVVSTFAIAELLTLNSIKLFGTTIQESISNSMWNYGAALSLIMLLLIIVTSLFNVDEKGNTLEGGTAW